MGYQSRQCLSSVKKEYKYYEYDKTMDIFLCGRGNLSRILVYCEKQNIQYTLNNIDLCDNILEKPLEFTGKLRDYQAGVPEEIIQNGCDGVVKLGTGYGKTLIALEMIRLLNKTALIIVPRVSILNQFKQTLKEFYDYKAGIIQGGVSDVQGITVASMATLKSRDKKGGLKEIEKRFGIVIADEAHTVISDKGIKVIQRFNPRHLYGLTATPRRTDEQGDAIFYTFGPILCDKQLDQAKPTVQVVKSNCKVEVNVDYGEMITEITEDQGRNILIANIARREFNNKRKILILTKRIKHYEEIKAWLHSVMKIHTISSEMKPKERDELLTKLRNNEKDFDIILGTFSMLSTGVDIPALDTLILAGDIKSSVLTEQSTGRILRIFNGKASPKIIDIDDNLNGMLHRQFLERQKFYKESGWEIKI